MSVVEIALKRHSTYLHEGADVTCAMGREHTRERGPRLER